VRFKAGGAYPFFGTSVATLTDDIVSLDELWGADATRLRDDMAQSRGPEENCQVLQQALATRLHSRAPFAPVSAAKARRAIQLLDESAELPSVEELARRVDLSARQLRRAFDDVVGVSPKVYSRILRFRRALREARCARTPSWSAIAASVGYWDQAHLIAEFRALTGKTPGALLSSRRDVG
jgi:AraC-like DNA-binding protein